MGGLYQRRIGVAPLARREFPEPERADGDAYQPQGREPDCRGHAPHLAVAALGDRQL